MRTITNVIAGFAILFSYTSISPPRAAASSSFPRSPKAGAMSSSFQSIFLDFSTLASAALRCCSFMWLTRLITLSRSIDRGRRLPGHMKHQDLSEFSLVHARRHSGSIKRDHNIRIARWICQRFCPKCVGVEGLLPGWMIPLVDNM